MDRPRQAVILAGGRGTRLAPLTLTRPKPMIEFHGRPFLEYLLEMLREQGFERVLLLLGYLPDAIRNHFGDGSDCGLRIEYSVTGVDNDTGRRLRLAAPLCEESFLLMYCDNYWPMRMDDMCRTWAASGVPAQLTCYRNKDGYTRSNLRVAPDGRVETYDRSRTAPDLAGVDIGFVLMRRSLLDDLPDTNCSFEQTVYPRLIHERLLHAYLTEHRYYSVGSHERLPITDEFLRRRPAVFVDRDGVLNRRMPRAQYVTRWEEWEWLPGALEGLRLFHESGCRVFVITNQPGVARGALTAEDLDHVHRRMCEETAAAGGAIDAVYDCRHNWDENCECRKPRPGMLFQAQREHHLDLTRMVFFGDDERDGEAAAAAGCRWIPITNNTPLLSAATQYLRTALERVRAGCPAHE